MNAAQTTLIVQIGFTACFFLIPHLSEQNSENADQ